MSQDDLREDIRELRGAINKLIGATEALMDVITVQAALGVTPKNQKFQKFLHGRALRIIEENDRLSEAFGIRS